MMSPVPTNSARFAMASEVLAGSEEPQESAHRESMETDVCKLPAAKVMGTWGGVGSGCTNLYGTMCKCM